MVDETGPPFQSFAGGFFSGRVMSELREMAELTWYQMQSVDGAATIGSSMTSQTTGYQIQAAITNFTTVTPAVTGNGNTPTAAAVLPQTSRPFPLAGVLLYVSNVGANPINLYPHPNDSSNSINLQALNTPVILGINTITALQCITPGVWQADGIGEGFNAAIATVVSQGSITAAGTSSQANSTPIVQAMVQVTAAASTNGVRLPPATPGTQIVMNGGGGGATSFLVYPNGTDQINGGGAGASFTFTPNPTTTSPQIFFCFVAGNWQTK